MSKKKIIRIEMILLGIHPFLALPIMLKNLAKRDKYQIITFAIFFSILAYFFIPPKVYDLHERYHYYTYYQPHMFSEYNDYYLGTLTVIGRFLGLKKNILGFISAFILYYYLLKMGYETTSRKITTKKLYIIYMFIYALSVPLVFFNGIRFPVGMVLYIYGIYSFYYKNKIKRAYIYMILGALSHFSIFIFIFIFIIFEYFFINIKNAYVWQGFIIMAFILGSSSTVITSIIINLGTIINLLAGHEILSISTYVTGEWGASRYDYLSPIEAAKELLMVFATKILLLLHSLLRKAYSPLYKYTVFFSGIALLVAPFYTLFGRISQVLIILILVLNTTEDFLEKELNKVNIILLVMIFIAAFGIFFEIKEEREIFIMSYLANPIISGFRILVELVVN